jgi:hypothetical protein
MTANRPTQLRPFRDRPALLARQQELADAAKAIDTEQQRLAVEFARVQRELADLHELLWPSDDGRAFAKSRRPGMPGPAPVPPPIADATPLRGRALRDAALRVLLRAEGPLTLTEIHRALHLSGGVVRRVRRGTYVLGSLTPYRRRAITALTRWQP